MAGNNIVLSGNLTKDPDLRATPGGKFVLNFRIAVDKAGDKGEDAGFFECVAWGDLAENLANSLTKGQRVIVTGQVRHRTYEVEGNKRSAIELLVDDAGPSMLWARASVTKQAPVKKAS